MNETLGIMQPYFFPYIGYFQLIAAVQRGLVFDIVKYKRKSWMNRNRVLDSKGDWQYISVPVCVSEGALIKDATIIDLACAHRRITNQLEHYRGKAPTSGKPCTWSSRHSAHLPPTCVNSTRARCKWSASI